MHRKIDRWIYVTGAPRSGTTFVGKILSPSIRVDYIHEPFNPGCGISGVNKNYLYLERDSERELALRPVINDLFDYKAQLHTGYYKNDTGFQRFAKTFVGSRGPFYLRLARANPFHNAAVIKDPVGCLLTKYLVDAYDVKPVILIRHPFGFVASAKKLGWENSLDPFIEQQDLADRFFDDEELQLIERYKSGSVIGKAALTWRLLNKVLLRFHEMLPDAALVTHEQLSAEPIPTFELIFKSVGLPFSQSIQRRIEKHTSGDSKFGRRRVQRFKRDSKSIAARSQATLDAAEKAEIMLIAEPIASKVYKG
jgi:hypothetical protein